jgi:hypothetical protein
MQRTIDPRQYKDLAESKAALARHGIVIIRSIELDLEPAIMSGARDSMASSPNALGEMNDEQLDEFMEGLRKAAMKSAKDLRALYIRLLAQLGTEYIGDLVKELDGIERLFTWERVLKSTEPVNKRLSKAGFRPIRLQHAQAVSESFAVELNERWPVAFDRFKGLACEAAKELGDERPVATPEAKPRRKSPPKRKTKTTAKKKGGPAKKG